MQVEVDLIVSFPKWNNFIDINIELINTIIKTTLSEFANFTTFKLISVSVLLANDSYMRYLNKRYLNKNKPTNVLSFPEFNFQYNKISEFKCNLENLYLGNIILGLQKIEKEAAELQISVKQHFIHLCVHATLHLLGFDHEKEHDAIIMETLEQKLLQNIIKNL
jgi:probable rRNA maturation factor